MLDFLTGMGREMTGTLGSTVTGARKVAIRSHSQFSLAVI